MVPNFCRILSRNCAIRHELVFYTHQIYCTLLLQLYPFNANTHPAQEILESASISPRYVRINPNDKERVLVVKGAAVEGQKLFGWLRLVGTDRSGEIQFHGARLQNVELRFAGRLTHRPGSVRALQNKRVEGHTQSTGNGNKHHDGTGFHLHQGQILKSIDREHYFY